MFPGSRALDGFYGYKEVNMWVLTPKWLPVSWREAWKQCECNDGNRLTKLKEHRLPEEGRVQFSLLGAGRIERATVQLGFEGEDKQVPCEDTIILD